MSQAGEGFKNLNSVLQRPTVRQYGYRSRRNYRLMNEIGSYHKRTGRQEFNTEISTMHKGRDTLNRSRCSKIQLNACCNLNSIEWKCVQIRNEWRSQGIKREKRGYKRWKRKGGGLEILHSPRHLCSFRVEMFKTRLFPFDHFTSIKNLTNANHSHPWSLAMLTFWGCGRKAIISLLSSGPDSVSRCANQTANTIFSKCQLVSICWGERVKANIQ